MPDSCWATQSLDVTVATGISFWRSIFGWKGTGDYPATSLFGVTLGSTLVYYDSLTATTSGEITSATTGWENIIIDVSSYSGANDFTFTAYATADQNTYALQILIDDVELLPSSIVSATIEDSSKTWTADQFNTDGMFILTSGDVKGYSCTILDTFENYIQVPTTFANIINNIESGTTYYAATVQLTNGGFEEGDFTDWDYTPEDFDVNEEHKFATGGIQSATVHNGSHALWYEAWCDGYPDSTEFSLCTATFDITEITKITFWYNIPTLVSGGNVYLRVRVAADGDGETPVVVSEDYHSVTDGWVQGVLNVATLSGTAYLHFYGYVPLPEW